MNPIQYKVAWDPKAESGLKARNEGDTSINVITFSRLAKTAKVIYDWVSERTSYVRKVTVIVDLDDEPRPDPQPVTYRVEIADNGLATLYKNDKFICNLGSHHPIISNMAELSIIWEDE